MFEEEYYEPTFDEDIDLTDDEFAKDEIVLNVIKAGELDEVVVGMDNIEKFLNEYRAKCSA